MSGGAKKNKNLGYLPTCLQLCFNCFLSRIENPF